MSALRALDKALTARFRGDATLVALVPGGIHSGSAPSTSVRPYLVFGSPNEESADVLGMYGKSATIEFDAFSAPSVRSASAVNEILDRVEVLLRTALTLDGHTAARLHPDARTVLIEEDETRHGWARYTLTTFES